MNIITKSISALVLMLAFAGPASAFTAERNRIILDITLAAGGGSHSVFVRVNEKKQTIDVRGFVEGQFDIFNVTRVANSYGAKNVCVHLFRSG